MEKNKLQKLEDAQGETQTTRRTQETGFTGDTTDQKKSKKYFYFFLNVRLTHNSTPEVMINKWETNKKNKLENSTKNISGDQLNGLGTS